MTPQEKALDLYNRMIVDFTIDKWQSKQCALIAIENEYNAKIQAYNEMAEFCPDVASQAAIYAEREKEEVKKEIEKL